jgi:UDP-3-O-[3-hydroxymyristoyl] glucosamine N-acyltransferase LpxD
VGETKRGKLKINDMTKQALNIPMFGPSDCRYDEGGVWVGKFYYKCDNPRLEFARILDTVKDSKEMVCYIGSWFAKDTVVDYSKVAWGYGCVVGGQGFGYEYTEKGELIRMPHHGNVIIEDDVTLHNNVCIDRAVLGSTVIGAGTKIDNLVHVAHGVRIGKNCLIVSGVVFGGSCDIGDYSFIGMNASIKQKVKIGRNCVIGAGAVVTKDVPDNQVWVGNPARFLKETEPRKYPV